MITENSRLSIIFLFLFSFFSQVASAQELRLETPDVVLNGIGFPLTVTAVDTHGNTDNTANGELHFSGFTVDGSDRISLQNGVFSTKTALVHGNGSHSLSVRRTGDEATSAVHTVRVIPGLLSILPPLLAILLALIFRQVIIALIAGIWLGASFIYGYNPFIGFLRVLDVYIVTALTDKHHVSIILFSMLFGGMVGIMSKSGGTFGIANKLSAIAHTPRRGMVVTWMLGLLIFFDDYANSLIVGNTMRPITDRLRISREKLAYLVDSTAAPVSSLLFVSTWIGYEVGLLDQAMKQAGLLGHNTYIMFINMIPYSFYPIFTLAFALLLVVMDRDFGPMQLAERRARKEGKLHRDSAQLAIDHTDSTSILPAEGVIPRWWNAALPIFTVLGVTLIGLYITGKAAITETGTTDYSIGNIIGESDPFQSLLWASLLACVVAMILAVGQKTIDLHGVMDAWFSGLKSMLFAMVILTLAWSIGQLTADLHTASYLVDILRDTLDPHWLPAFTFLIAAAVSFATGTSWGTMGIMIPLVIPLAAVLGAEAVFDSSHSYSLLVGSAASVLAGSVFGDHCSPISDTTILSSMASACDHIDHVRTQLPYAIVPAIVSLFIGLIPVSLDITPLYSLPIGIAILFIIIRYIGVSNTSSL